MIIGYLDPYLDPQPQNQSFRVLGSFRHDESVKAIDGSGFSEIRGEKVHEELGSKVKGGWFRVQGIGIIF